VPVEQYGVPKSGGHVAMDEILTNDFIFSVLEGRPPLVNAREAARSCAATITAQKSAWVGAKVLKIPQF
jgi:hypothetical protein